MFLVDKVVSLLPAKLQPIAKAVAPAVVGLIAVGVQYATDGTFNVDEIRTGIVAVVTAGVVFLVPNRSK